MLRTQPFYLRRLFIRGVSNLVCSALPYLSMQVFSPSFVLRSLARLFLRHFTHAQPLPRPTPRKIRSLYFRYQEGSKSFDIFLSAHFCHRLTFISLMSCFLSSSSSLQIYRFKDLRITFVRSLVPSTHFHFFDVLFLEQLVLPPLGLLDRPLLLELLCQLPVALRLQNSRSLPLLLLQ
jgi:hypothetical protein